MLELYIDTREQKKLEFNEPYISKVHTATMSYGDYGCKIDGKRVPVVFERKSKSDLWGTLGSTRAKHDRFKKEIARARADGVELIVIIECPFLSIDHGHNYKKHGKSIKCKFGGRAMIRKLNTMAFRYDIRYVCCKNREEMSLYIQEFYYSMRGNH